MGSTCFRNDDCSIRSDDENNDEPLAIRNRNQSMNCNVLFILDNQFHTVDVTGVVPFIQMLNALSRSSHLMCRL
jgi:hypothetical protein